MVAFRKDLSIPGLIKHIHSFFSKVSDPRQLEEPEIHFVDHLMSGFAVFSLTSEAIGTPFAMRQL